MRFCVPLLYALLTGAGCAASDAPVSNDPTFVDVSRQAGLAGFQHETGAQGNFWFPETMGAGCGFLDYEGDGWQDILLVAGGNVASDRSAVAALQLFRNNRDGTFTEVTEEAGLSGLRAYGFGLTVADVDVDGDDDVYLTTLRRDILLLNEAGVFVDATEHSGLPDEPSWTTAAIFFDPDVDGDPDLYVGRYVAWSPETDQFCSLDGNQKDYCTPALYEGLQGSYFQNRGDGRFLERTAASGLAGGPGKTLGLTDLDYNRDGWPDLAVANDLEPDLLFENQQDGTFNEVGLLAGVAFDEHGGARSGMGIDAGVIDGAVTLLVGNFSDQKMSVFRYDGDGLFSDVASTSGIGYRSLRTLTFGLFLFDVDLDGDQDVFAANGHVQTSVADTPGGVSYRQRPHLFVYDNGRFEDEAERWSLTEPLLARGAAYADYDRDGDVDVLVTENGGSARLYRNDIRSGDEPHPAFLRVSVTDKPGDALGTRIVAYVGGVAQERRVRTSSTYLSASERIVTFGLGRHARVDSMHVYWPEGTVQRFEQISANQTLIIQRGDEPVRISPTTS